MQKYVGAADGTDDIFPPTFVTLGPFGHLSIRKADHRRPFLYAAWLREHGEELVPRLLLGLRFGSTKVMVY